MNSRVLLAIVATLSSSGCVSRLGELPDAQSGLDSPCIHQATHEEELPLSEASGSAGARDEEVPTPDQSLDSANSTGGESLEQAWAVALSIDPGLEASRWQSSAAQRGLNAARAEKLPSVSARASYAVFDNPLTLIAPIPAVGPIPPGTAASVTANQREFFLGGVRLTQPLYTFGRIDGVIDSAGAEVNAAVANEQRTELDVKLQVAAAYVAVLKAKRMVEVAEANVTSLTAHERDVQNLVNSGVGIRANLLAVQVALANARQFRLQMNNLQEVANAAYNRTLQRPLDTPVELLDRSQPASQYDLDSAIHEALAQRPEVEYLSAKAQALRRMADSVHAGNKPQIVLAGGFSFIENRFLDNEAYNDVTVMADWNFWDSGRKKHRTAQLEQAAEGLLRQRSEVESVIALQVKTAWHSLDSNQERVRVNKQSLESADENVRVSRNRYKAGAGTNTEVLDAQRLRTDAYSSYYTSLYDAILSEMNLLRAIGTL